MFDTCFLAKWLLLALVGATLGSYNEILEIQPLPNNYLHTSFSFETRDILKADSNHYGILPRSLLKVTRRSNVVALHLRFTRGRWNHEIWGALPRKGQQIGGTGIEVWADIVSEDAEKDWTSLVNSLSGLFCASMNFIDTTRTVRPQWAFRDHNQGDIFYGVLPSETICTENLTPFLKLLPCKGRAGISSLLTGHKMFDTDWSALSVDIHRVGDHLEVLQHIDMVFDLNRALSSARDPLPASQPEEELICQDGKFYTSDVTCFPQDGRSFSDWSFAQVFGKSLKGYCALAEKEAPALIVHHGRNTRLVPNSPSRTENMSSYQLQADHLNLQYSDSSDPVAKPAPIEIYRSLTSHGSALHGKITLSVTNKQDEEVELIYFSVLPWFMRPYLHSLRTNHEDIILETRYKPAKDRLRPTHLELRMRVPAQETALVTFDFDRTVLRYAEYPPDANRGFDVPAAVIIMNSGEYVTRTTSQLLSLPTPDFSMPYNVIILTCTVVALCFGSMFNLLSRRIVLVSDAPIEKGLKQKLSELRLRLFSKKAADDAKAVPPDGATTT